MTACRRAWAGSPFAAALAVAALGTMALGCGDGSRDTSTVIDETPPDLEGAALESAVEIVATGCGPQPNRGLGGVLDPSAVVTAAHTIAGSSSVLIALADGTTLPAAVVLLDDDLDIALLRTAASAGPGAALRIGAPDPGASGAVAVRSDDDGGGGRGGDDGRALTAQAVEVLRAVTIRTTDIHLDTDVERAGYEVAGTVQPGDSGSLVHVAGGAIGIVWARSTESPGRAWAVALPEVIVDRAQRDALVDAVDTGTCV